MATRTPLTLPALDRIPWLRYAVTERDATRPLGGDMSFTTGKADPDGIIINRCAALQRIGLAPEQAVMCGLVHGTIVRAVDGQDAGRGVLSPATSIGETDGLITHKRGLSLMMCFADCVPLLLVDTTQRVIGLAHAGWRGTLAGMAGALVASMRETYHSDFDSLLAVIGPSIGPQAYTVGAEVISAFSEAYPDDILFRSDTRGTQLDLWEANTQQFIRAGVRPAMISCARICTLENGVRFFSHRYAVAHDEPEGRFAVLLAIEE